MMTREALLRAIKEAKEKAEELYKKCCAMRGDDTFSIVEKWDTTNEHSNAVERYCTLVDVLSWEDDES